MASENFNPEVVYSSFSESVYFLLERHAEILVDLGVFETIEEAKNELMSEINAI